MGHLWFKWSGFKQLFLPYVSQHCCDMSCKKIPWCDTTALHKVNLSSSYHNDCTNLADNFNALSNAGVLH